jgi:putative transposase
MQWNVSTRIDTNLRLGALEEALATREVKPGLIHHSDRGVQYASYADTERLLNVGVQISMSAKGNAYDNAKAESCFKTLKQEEVYLKQYQTVWITNLMTGWSIPHRIQANKRYWGAKQHQRR